MSAAVKDPPPYIIPVEGKGDDIKVYKVHTPFNPASSKKDDIPMKPPVSSDQSGSHDKIPTFSSTNSDLGRSPGTTTCISCKQQVLTNVTYKVGAFAWLMCLLFILCGLVIGCCLIPFFVKYFKDAYHTCPRCNRILHVEKKRCCSS